MKENLLRDIRKKTAFAGINIDIESERNLIPDSHRPHERLFPNVATLEETYLGKPIGIVGMFNLGSSSVHGDFIDLANYFFTIKDDNTADFKTPDGLPYDYYCMLGALISKVCIKFLSSFKEQKFADTVKISYEQYYDLFNFYLKTLHIYKDNINTFDDLAHLRIERLLALSLSSVPNRNSNKIVINKNLERVELYRKHIPLSKFDIEIGETPSSGSRSEEKS